MYPEPKLILYYCKTSVKKHKKRTQRSIQLFYICSHEKNNPEQREG